VEWSRNLPTITTQKHVKGKACPSAYPKLVNSLCEHIVKTSRSEWEIKFFFILLVALCLLYFSLRRKRAGVACFAIFLGLGLGIGAGAVFFFLGAWLIIRAYRLQKYGVAGMVASNQVAREMAQARREGREPNIQPPPSASASPQASGRRSAKNPTAPKGPDASKRYTPKKRTPKRR
ncbi:MAG TPA: hypothetical protein VMF33_07225, partial [Acidimicrobiales bacterium]|nr:hypothetical protein [Acidimicrobiales bacterium]